MPTHANKSYGWIKREGKLGGPGYTKKTTAARHRILAGVVKKYGYRSALGSIMALERSTQISATVRKVLVSDRVWLRETYGAASKKRAAAAGPIRRRSIPAHRRVPAAPRSRVEIRGLLARAGFRLLGTGNSVSYTARGERGPRVTAPFPKTMAAARALIKRARPNYREGRAGGGMEASFAAYARAGRPSRALSSAQLERAVAKRRTTRKKRMTAAREFGRGAGVLAALRGAGPSTRRTRRNPQLPMGATKHASAYVVMWNRGSIERQKVADIYRSRKGGYFVIYTVGSLPHTIIDVERRTASGARDEVHEYLETEVPEMLKTSSGQMRAIKIIPAKGEKVPDAKLKRNGRTECGYHGVPTIRGECVVCAYEADVR
jgi:hypothetical protein